MRTRAALVDAALPAFAEYGFEGASLRAIAGRTGINIAMVAYHFTDKAGLYDAAIDRMVEIGLTEFAPRMVRAERVLADDPPDPATCRDVAGFLIEPFLRMTITDASAAWGKLMLREQLSPSRGFPALHERLVGRLIDLLAALRASAGGRGRTPDDTLAALAMYGEAMIFLTNHASVGVLLGERLNAPDFMEDVTRAILARHFPAASAGAP